MNTPHSSNEVFASLFDDPNAWQVVASGQAQGWLEACRGPDNEPGLQLGYDFHGGGGFVAIRRVVEFTLPETFEIRFGWCGEGPPNHLEFKVVDTGGANVWRHLRSDVTPAATWAPWVIHERDLPFAWGPAGGGAPSQVGAVEFVIAAGPGGCGKLRLTAAGLLDETFCSPRAVTASSCEAGYPAAAIMSGDTRAEWRACASDARPWWAVDFGRVQRFGGLVIGWPDGAARACAVEVTVDGRTWSTIYQATVSGRRTFIATPGAQARQLRIRFQHAEHARLLDLSLKPDAFSHTPHEFIHHLAAEFPRGWFPRYWYREQSYWTPVGSPLGKRRALINEEGMVEIDEGGFSLEPFVLTESGCLTWADVMTEPSLARGGLPVPAVTWKHRGIKLEIRPWVDGDEANLTLHVTYRLKRRNPQLPLRLVVAARPFQVTPPWQAFRNLGGRSHVRRLETTAACLRVDGRRVLATPAADTHGAAEFAEEGLIRIPQNAQLPCHPSIDDHSGLGSAAFAWELPAGQRALEVTLSVPYFDRAEKPLPNSRRAALAVWRKTLGGVQWRVSTTALPAIGAFRTAAGHILINRDGPAIQPGPRRYTRSWIRDCVIMGAALAKAGLPAPLREFLTWYAAFQRDDGFIPCVVDRDGIDWLVEHDSHGQFLWAVREVHRHEPAPDLLATFYPRVRLAADYIISLRTTPRAERDVAFHGLLPESASHEGYLAHPVHAYWDDFWGIRGLHAAADVAHLLGFDDDAQRWRHDARAFEHDVLQSLTHVIASRGLNYIPGSVEWADFDPTATANAIAQLDFAPALPAGPMHAMLDTYLDGFRRKHRGDMPWNNYTAYEIRIIGAMVRCGRRHDAHELLERFLADRRPPAWNQWPEITWRDPRSPGHLGDIPHTWIAAEYMLALTAMVADERDASGSLVLAAGLPWPWIAESPGVHVRNLPTRFGNLDFSISATHANHIDIDIAGLHGLPRGGLILQPPLPGDARIVQASTLQPTDLTIIDSGRSLAVTRLPCSAELVLG